jgi:hypothetical protein
MMKAGDKIKMDGEKQRYTVQAIDSDFAICTKPFNARKTYLYFIADRKQALRGPISRWGVPYEFNDTTGAAQAIAESRAGQLSISSRWNKPLTAGELQTLWPTP